MRRQVLYLSIGGKRFLLALFICCILGYSASGQTGGPYKLEWSTIDGGGGTSTGGQYTLTGTIGQPDAGHSESGSYQASGGFWPGGPLCFVDFPDFARFAQYWYMTDTGLPADLSGNGAVDFTDLGLFLYDWLCPCPYNWPLR